MAATNDNIDVATREFRDSSIEMLLRPDKRWFGDAYIAVRSLIQLGRVAESRKRWMPLTFRHLLVCLFFHNTKTTIGDGMFLNKELSVNGISLRGICVLRLELLLDEKHLIDETIKFSFLFFRSC